MKKQQILEVYHELSGKLSHAADVLTKTAHADMSANGLTLCLAHSLEVLREEIDAIEELLQDRKKSAMIADRNE